MYPLLERDDLPVPYIATMVMFVVISDQINDLLERKTTALNRMVSLVLISSYSFFIHVPNEMSMQAMKA